MSNFVDDLTSLPTNKTDLIPVVSGTEAYHIAAAEWNAACQASIDLRGKVVSLIAGGGGGGPVTGTTSSDFTITQPYNSGTQLLYGLVLSASGTQNGVTNGYVRIGDLYVADPMIGLQAFKISFGNSTTPRHTSYSFESSGTFAAVGQGERRSRVEGYDKDGQVNPSFRITTYPSMGYEWNQGYVECSIGAVTRSGSTVTAGYTNHGFEVGQVLSVTCTDPNFPPGTNVWTVTSVPNANQFVYTDTGSGTATNVAIVQYSTETSAKLRMVGNQHLQLIFGPYGSETIGMEFFRDSMVTSAGYGASYGGSFILQPTFITSAYSRQAGSWYPCDASGGAYAFTLPANGNYFSKAGTEIDVTKTDSSGNAVTITAPSGVSIRTSSATVSTLAISTQGKNYKLKCDGKGGGGGNDTWYVVATN